MEGEDSTSRGEDDPDQEHEQELDHDLEAEDDGSGPSSAGPHTVHSASTRQARNQAEKNRRDKLNAYITQLATLVPIINYSPKKLDKTSILRLAATYIRLHNVVFGNIKKDSQQFQSPECLTSINWSESVLEMVSSLLSKKQQLGPVVRNLEQILPHIMYGVIPKNILFKKYRLLWIKNYSQDIGGGMLLIATGNGKIIFISNAVEKILGHTQIELMGHSLFSLTCLEDHAELKRNLSPSDSAEASTSNGDVGSLDDSDSDSSSGPPTPPLQHHLQLQGPDTINETTDVSPERRSFYIRLRQRAVSKSDHPQYELVHVVGHLRVPSKKISRPSTSRKRDQPTNSNDIILVAVARPFKEKRITYLSLSEAYREEFITRHAVDGNIIYTDHRVSTVSGYLSEEVVGVPGFKFMHKDDMRWTVIALRQMYFRGHSYGTSVYRLQSKTGKFIYIKTHGYLEINEAIDDVQSFLCINTLVSDNEGVELLHKMKELYAPLIRDNVDTTISLIVENKLQISEFDDDPSNVIDPSEVTKAVKQMLSNLPPLTFHPHIENSGFEVDDLIAKEKFAQAQMLAKTMPSINEQAAKIGYNIQSLCTSASIANTLVPIRSPKTPVAKYTPPSSTIQLNRPSVLRHASRPPKYVVPNEVSVVKRLRTDEQGRGVVVSDANSVPCRAGVVVTAGKRKLEEDVDWLPPPMMNDISETGLSGHSPVFTYSQPPTLEQPISPLIDLHPAEIDNSSSVHLLDSMSYLISLSDLEEHSQVHLEEDYELHSLGQPGNIVWDKPERLDSELYKAHYSLDSNFEMQETQINAIEQAIDSVPKPHIDQMNSSILTEIKAELKKEKQSLITLRQDHQSCQHGLI